MVPSHMVPPHMVPPRKAPPRKAPPRKAPAGDALVWSGRDLVGVGGEVGGCPTMQLHGATSRPKVAGGGGAQAGQALHFGGGHSHPCAADIGAQV